ncbi:MAG TPA: glucan biosynthesis protein G [Candidatus Competibacteraceae bacterium]|nr:glucan biosynthesis protein G [Candidatus Competibacteraceae bacterium]HRY17520.1 glucan biosynthesis protein G [Candidatus Competibacteraceae bacterium]
MKLQMLLSAVVLVSLCAGPIVSWGAPNVPEATPATTPPPKRFNFADVRRRAEVLATQPFKAPGNDLPKFFKELNYDQYRDIRFQADKSLWRAEALPFEVQFVPLGFLFKQPVAINVVEEGASQPVEYANDLFDYGKNQIPDDVPKDLGFSGFKVLYPLHIDGRYDEVAVFQGASYFRAVGQNQNYGISARGLAIDTGLPKPEEFPYFREFWLEKPDKDATELTVYALLDSQSVTGAYRFMIKPGVNTQIEVKASLFVREKVQKFGVAPLTSMFFHGALNERFFDDFRPQVHDSDGLLMMNGNGEWIWRPLNNPARLRISAFQDQNPHGFGLLQRDRDFDDYQDLEAHYHIRPSIWVEPQGQWGKGSVQLIEIPSDAERYDNIAAFWVPEKPVEPGQQLEYNYRLYFFLEMANLSPGGRVLSSRIGASGAGDLDPSHRRFVIDFGGNALAQLADDAPVEAMVTSSSGQIKNVVTHKNPYINGWRVSFELLPQEGDPADLRCFLKLGNNVLTETWSYQWTLAK